MVDGVTVVIPCHTEGRKDWLEQAKNSFPAGQPVKIAWNDGNVCEAFNAGILDCNTEFVYCFGADDVALPGLLEHLHAWAWNADVVYPTMVLTSEDLSRTLGVFHADWYSEHRLPHSNYITGASLFRRSKLLQVGGFRDLPHLEDWDLMLRLQRAGARFKACPQARFLYRQVPNSRNKSVQVSLDEVRAEFGVADRQPLLATFYNQATPATTYNRCVLPARHLPGAVHSAPVSRVVANVPDPRSAADLDVELPEHEGAAVFQFAADQERAGITLYMRQFAGIRTLVETDDNYLAMFDRGVRERSGWVAKIGQGTHSAEGHRKIVRDASGVIVTCEALARSYRKVNANVFVCPNTVDPADWPEPVKPDDGVLRIGWSASRSHVGDAVLVRRALEWASRQKDVEVVVQGVGASFRFPHAVMRWDDDLDAYRTRWAYYDVALAPIVPNPWSVCRSDLKALEAAMGSCAPVLSNVEPYAAWTDGSDCLKAATAKDFLHIVKHLVANRDEVRQLAAAARAYVLGERTTQAQIHKWREAVAD